MSDRINEELIIQSPIMQIDPFIFKASKSICKILTKQKVATGFLIKLYKGDDPFYCLMTNEHVISHDLIDNKEEIEIYYANQEMRAKINLDKNERFIRDYMFINIDAIVIEILVKDKINEYFFLMPNLDYLNDYDSLLNKKICTVQFPKGGDLSYSKGEISFITQYEFTHLASTLNGSSGSPVFLDGIPLVIGIHKQGKIDNTENYGNFIGPVVNSLKENLQFDKKIYDNGVYEGEFKNKRREGYGKYTTNDGVYYIGLFYKGLRHGKGADYYKNKTIMHEGEFIKDQLEGKGKYYDKDGSYYIGEFLHGLRHGKGTDYYSKDKVKYEGDFVKDKREGHGKYIFPDGEFYIGEFLNGKFNGKGTEYYKDGKVKYEGYFENGLYEGEGKYVEKDGNYYIGTFSKGLQHGKGTEYYKNNKIEYEGEFLNDKREGYGKYISENGEYYIGQFFNDVRHGKGIQYYKNNTIMYEGEFVNNEYDGKGKYIDEKGYLYEGEFKNGLKHGKGILYYKNGNIKYEGEFSNGKFVKKNDYNSTN